jgi:hypothetical protein
VNEIEQQALDFLLRGEHPTLAVLRDQAAAAYVAKRDFTGVGFFTHFDVPSTAARLPSRGRIVISDVHAEVVGLQHGAGLVLFIDNGTLHTLECFIYDDAWPVEAKLIRLYYVRPRDSHSGALIETPVRDLQWAIHGTEA